MTEPNLRIARRYLLFKCPHCQKKVRVDFRADVEFLKIEKEK